jgi:ankyrin repeat protein
MERNRKITKRTFEVLENGSSDPYGQALKHASENNNLEIVKLLIDNGSEDSEDLDGKALENASK